MSRIRGIAVITGLCVAVAATAGLQTAIAVLILSTPTHYLPIYQK